MTDNFIQLNENNTLKFKIKSKDGIETGEILEFDLEDIELPLKYQEMLELDKKAREHLKNQLIIIDKKQDVKGKKLLSKNEEEKFIALRDFFKKEVEVYNMFLGEKGVEKLLNGRKLGWTSLKEIDTIIEKQIAPYINVSLDDITEKIKEKYSIKKDDNILK